MSATNRGGERRDSDYYRTPEWVTERLMEQLGSLLPAGLWIEPAVGDGSIIKAVNKHIQNIRWLTNDIRKMDLNWLANSVQNNDDFLTMNLPATGPGSANVVITNPPYSKALEFCKKALTFDATVIMLLRMNFAASKVRHPFFTEHMPDIYIIPNRPSFTDDGHTDATEYAWFVWPARMKDRKRGSVEILGLTPKSVRCPKRPSRPAPPKLIGTAVLISNEAVLDEGVGCQAGDEPKDRE